MHRSPTHNASRLTLPTLGSSGFTFIEMIAAMALMAVLAAISGMGIVAAMESYTFSRANVQLAQEGQFAMNRLTRELMELTRILQIRTESDPFIIYERLYEVDGTPSATPYFAIQFDSANQRVVLHTELVAGLGTPDPAAGDLLINGVSDFSLRYFEVSSELPELFDYTRPSVIQIGLALIRPDNPAHIQRFTARVHMRNR